LPIKFGLVIDGWKGLDGVYYIGIYAIYILNGAKKKPLLALMPPLDETDHGAESHANSINETLQWYNKTVENVLYLVSDNCSTMQKLARDFLDIPFVGKFSRY
jgi:hypothetical protein